MNRILGAALVAALAGSPLALEAQTTPRAAQGQWGGQQGGQGARALSIILQHRQDLALTDAQVSRLEAIGTRLDEQNRPLFEQLRAEGGAGAWGGGQARERAEAMTPEQLEEVRRRMEERRQNGDARRGERSAGEARGWARGQREGARRGGMAGPRGQQATSEQQSVRQQIQANTRAAGEEAWSVLTPEQQVRARQIGQQRRQELTERLRDRQGQAAPRR